MGKDIKILLAGIVISLLAVLGAAKLFSGEVTQALPNIEGVVAAPQNYDLGQVPLMGGLVTKEYEVANNTGEDITLKRITTSCMCTEAKIEISGQESDFFGMEHSGDRNAPVNLTLPKGEKAKVTVQFDPAAHGPQGIGPFDRIVWLTFSDPGGVKELTFNGTVIN